MSDDRARPTFYERLIEAERAAGVTQAELSRRTGLTKSHISHMERGMNENPTLKNLTVLAQALGCSIDYLAGLDDDPGLSAAVSDLPRDDVSLIHTFIGVLRDTRERDGLSIIAELASRLRQTRRQSD